MAGARAHDVRVTRSATAHGRPARAAPHSGLPQRHEQRRQRHEPPPRPRPRASPRTPAHAWMHTHDSNTSGSNPPRPAWCRSRTAVQARGAPRATRRSNRRRRTLAGGGADAALFARSAVVPCCATCVALAVRLTCIDCVGPAGALGTATAERTLAVSGLGLRAAGADFLGFGVDLAPPVGATGPVCVLGFLVRRGLRHATAHAHATRQHMHAGAARVGGEVSLFYSRYVDTNTCRLGVPSWLEQSGSFLRVGLGRKGAETAVRRAAACSQWISIQQ